MKEPYLVLEEELARWTGARGPEFVVVCSSGTAALHLALEALSLPLGSRVVVPEFTMIACARAVSMANLLPVFVDCKRHNLLIDLDKADELLSQNSLASERMLVDEPATSAIMPVHIYGRCCDMGGILALSGKYGLKVVEDIAEAHGVKPHPISHAAAYSFYSNKLVSGQEGGAVVFRDSEAADKARKLRSLGFTEAHDFMHIPRGCNYRMSNIHATLVLNSLAEFDSNVKKRRELEEYYNAACPVAWRMPRRDSPWVYDIRISIEELQGPSGRPSTNVHNKIVESLNAQGIAARHSFKPMSVQSEYSSKKTLSIKRLPWQAARASMEVLYLPLDPRTVTHESIDRSFRIIQDVLERE